MAMLVAHFMLESSHMFKHDAAVIHDALVRHWRLPEPVHLADSLKAGVTADVWLVTDAHGDRYVAKFIYDTQPGAEVGLRVAEQVEANGDLNTGAPIRTHDGALTVMLPSVPGEYHPLAQLRYVAGPTAVLTAEEQAHLLVKVQAALATIHLPTLGSVIDYLSDDSIDIAYADKLRPILHDCVNDVLSIDELSWSTCYGDNPEAIRTEHGVALVDWGFVTHAPLLWDVAQWMRNLATDEERQTYLAVYRAETSLPQHEFAHLKTLMRLCVAHELRFRAFRLLHADHYADASEQADAVASLARRFGVVLPNSRL